MCGIVGLVREPGEPSDAAMEAAVRALAHRGPDGSGIVDIDGRAIFGHTRLSIIDLSPTGTQPMSTRDGRYTLTYNGEVYNYGALRKELEALGRGFQGTSDTEVVLNAFVEWGTDAFDRFDGMFALGIWDREKRSLTLARDRFGEKPLCFCGDENWFAFASELTALRALGRLDGRPPSLEATNAYLALGYIPAPLSAHPDVKKLDSASWLEWRPGRSARVSRYWDYAKAFRRRATGSERDMLAELEVRLEDAVRSRLVADVPVGAFLSGGLDSSTVVALARPAIEYPLHTFSIGFETSSYDESEDAARVARILGTTHHERKLPRRLGHDRVADAVRCYDEPFADTSLVPTVEVAKLAAEHRIKVVLTGDGADEIFAGYPTYQADRLMRVARWIPRAVRKTVSRLSLAALPASSVNKTALSFRARQFAGGLPRDQGQAHYAWREIHGLEERIAMLGPASADAIRDSDPAIRFGALWNELDGLHALDRALVLDARTWLTDDILVKVDRATMASSIESRTPFLARELVEFAAGLPASLKLGLRRGKRALRAAAQNHLPADVLAKKKTGFSAPINDWMGWSGDSEYRTFNRWVSDLYLTRVANRADSELEVA